MTAKKHDYAVELPETILKKSRWPYLLIWIVPVLAAIGAGAYFYDQRKDRGPEITIRLNDASGLKANDTPVSHLGVPIGKIIAVTLSSDQHQPLAKVRLQRSADAFAKKGARFWLVRPEISGASITGLSTIMSGPYIEAVPGDGEPADEFTALDKAPATLKKGLRIVLHAPRLQHLQPDSPVYFRGIQVGVIESTQLSSRADGIDIQLFIEQRYRPLVRAYSQFWLVKGVDLKGGLFSGVQLKVGSLESIITGGVTFATPETKMGPVVEDGAQFPLYDEPKKEWQDWSPQIPLGPDETAQDGALDLPHPSEAVRSAVK